MEQHKDEFAALGLNTIAVSIGEPKHARKFCDALSPSVMCLCNQMSGTHLTYGVQNGGLAQLAWPQVMLAGVRAAAQGHVQGNATGDVKILSATFLIDRDGLVRYAYYANHAGDHPNMKELLASVAEVLSSA